MTAIDWGFQWSAETQALHASALELGRRLRADRPAHEAIPLVRSVWEQLAGAGFCGMPVAQDLGGLGLSAIQTARVLDGLAQGCDDAGVPFALAAHVLAVALPVALQAADSSAELEEVANGLASGRLLGAHAATETGAGSDSGAIATRAARDGDVYVLNGTKTYVTNAPLADGFVVTAVVDASRGFQGQAAFWVPRALGGLSVGPPIAKMGLKGAPMAEVFFDEVRVPAAFRIGAEGEGAAVFRTAMVWERAVVLAPQLGVMRGQVARCVRHAQTRRQFGKPIARFQAVSHRIVEMVRLLEGAEAQLYRAAWTLDQHGGQATPQTMRAAALAKLTVAETAVRVHEAAVRVHGASGVTEELGVGRHLADAQGAWVHSGTGDIQASLVAALMGL